MDYSQGIVRRRRIIPASSSYFVASAATFTPCAGTPGFHSASPNDLTSAADWTVLNSTQSFNQSDPLGGTTASSIISNTSGVSFDTFFRSVPAFNMNGGTTYTFGVYLKSIAGPTWVLLQVFDGTANAVGSWFNISGSGAAGSSNLLGAGNTLTCAQIASSTNGYVQVSFGANLLVTNAGMKFEIYMVDGNGTGLSTLNQQIYAWQVCP